MRVQPSRGGFVLPRVLALLLSLLATTLYADQTEGGLVKGAPSQTGAVGLVAAPAAPAKSLSLDEALSSGLAKDPGLRSGSLDLLAAKAKAMDALYRMLPSAALSTGYTQLSEEPSPDAASVPPQFAPLLDLFGGAPSNSKDLRLDVSMPVFSGFRLREAAEIARLGAQSKEVSLEIARRALAFDITRAYWEAVRARTNVESLARGLELEKVVRAEIKSMADQGMATQADLLAEQARYDQTTLALDEAGSGLSFSYLILASLIGDASAALDPGAIAYDLVTRPGEDSQSSQNAGPADSQKAAAKGEEAGRQTQLLASALEKRPETKIGALALEISRHAAAAARGELLPTLLLTGNIAYSDPDPRLFPAQDKFNLTWSAGLRLRYDLGALPGVLARVEAAKADGERAASDLERQRNGIALDLRKCLLAAERTRNTLELTKGMVSQARENLRVTRVKFDIGMLKRSELLQAQLALLRSETAVTNKTIDVEIAVADLERALTAK